MLKIDLYATNKFNAHTGYGKMELGLYRALQDCGVTVDIAGGADGDIGLLVGNPQWGADYPHRRLWNYTMAESTAVNPAWVEALNQHFERLLVPCPPLVDVFRNSGVEIPIESVPLGVDYAPIRWRNRHLNGDKNIVMTYSLGDMRKNADGAMMSWHRVFRDDPAWPLVIKCRDNPRWAAGLAHPNTTIVRGEQTEAEYQALMDSAVIFVFPSRGEGFGLPPREAVLMGIPTIVTQWLGTWDAHRWAYPVTVLKMWPAQFSDWVYGANAKGGQWIDPSNAHLDEQLRYVSEHYDEALDHTWQGRNYLLSNFTWAHTAQRVIELIEGAA